MERFPPWLAFGLVVLVPPTAAAVEDGGAIALCVARTGVIQTIGENAPFLGIVVGPGATATAVTSESEFRALCAASERLGIP